jgi:hypothetical protein
VSSAIAIVDGDPPPSVALTRTASVTPADPVVRIGAESGGIDVDGVSVGDSAGASPGVSDGLGVLVVRAGSDAVSPSSSPQAASPPARARATTAAETAEAAGWDRVRAPERRGEVLMVLRR